MGVHRGEKRESRYIFPLKIIFQKLSQYSYECFLIHHMFLIFLFTMLSKVQLNQETFIMLFLVSILGIGMACVILQSITKNMIKLFGYKKRKICRNRN